MRISVVSQGNAVSDELKEYFSHRANLALGMYLRHVRLLRGVLEDTSNPQDGIIQCCRLELAGEFGKRFIVVHDRDLKSAIDCALSVSTRVVERALNRTDSEIFAVEPHQKLAS
jgi:hypothetical protein